MLGCRARDDDDDDDDNNYDDISFHKPLFS
jgi:hypothetical protein